VTTKTLEEARVAAERITGDKWCSNCQKHKPMVNGHWIVRAGGKVRRWQCESCVAIAKTRKSQ
jgi:hypothetical protein